MNNGYLTNFFFIGLGTLPPLLAMGGHLDIAMVLLFPLIVAAVLSGMNEDELAAVTAANEPEYGYAAENEPEYGYADAPSHDSAALSQARANR